MIGYTFKALGTRMAVKRAVALLASCFCLLASFWSVPAAAQDDHAPESSKVERKNRAPVSKDILRVTLPRATEATLSNGLTVLIMEDHRLPMISMQLNIGGAGPIFEPSNMPGLANTTAQMLREGTKTRSSLQIAEQTALLAAEVSGSAGFGSSATVL